jgi:hypothetical protein
MCRFVGAYAIILETNEVIGWASCVLPTPSFAPLRFINAAASCTPHLVAFFVNKVKLYLLISLFIVLIAFARAEPKVTRHPPQMWPPYMHYTMPHKV